jgi:hypothetical protein
LHFISDNCGNFHNWNQNVQSVKEKSNFSNFFTVILKKYFDPEPDWSHFGFRLSQGRLYVSDANSHIILLADQARSFYKIKFFFWYLYMI